MKTIIVLAIVLVFTCNAFNQQTNYSHSLEKQDYLHNSKKQKTAAWILLSGGFLVCTTGALIAATEVTTETIGFIFSGLEGLEAEEQNGSNASGIFIYTGLASMVGSIPLFTASSRNGRTAAMISTSIKVEEGSLVQQSALIKIQIPAIALKIDL